jgi:tetratricopeptide (TPR) repeat protein
MLKKMGVLMSWIAVCAVLLVMVLSPLYAQDALSDIKYKDDYDRIQKAVKIGEPAKRADHMVQIYKESPDMNSQLRDYADNLFAKDLESLMKQGNYIAIMGICERVLKVRPKFGEAYLFYGVALKSDKKLDEALVAFARGASIKGPLQDKAKQQLDVNYRQSHKGSLIGEDKLMKEAMKDLK